jgi:hypothetical protein
MKEIQDYQNELSKPRHLNDKPYNDFKYFGNKFN